MGHRDPGERADQRDQPGSPNEARSRERDQRDDRTQTVARAAASRTAAAAKAAAEKAAAKIARDKAFIDAVTRSEQFFNPSRVKNLSFGDEVSERGLFSTLVSHIPGMVPGVDVQAQNYSFFSNPDGSPRQAPNRTTFSPVRTIGDIVGLATGTPGIGDLAQYATGGAGGSFPLDEGARQPSGFNFASIPSPSRRGIPGAVVEDGTPSPDEVSGFDPLNRGINPQQRFASQDKDDSGDKRRVLRWNPKTGRNEYVFVT